MTSFDVSGVARVVGGTLEGRGGHARVVRAVIDSREVEPGDLFVALPGTRTHGHSHVADALRRGAAAALVGPDAGPLPEDVAHRAQVRVKFPRKALADVAAAHRLRLRCPVVGVTGSNGKSSTREMIARVLEALGPVVQSQRSFNNELGVPLTLLRADDATAALVVEIGTSERGEIAALSDIARPDVGVVTNVGPAHLEGLRSEEGVALEKGALPASLPEDGAAVLNHTDPRVLRMAGRTSARVVTFGVGARDATVWATHARRTPRGVEFFLYGKMRMFLPVPGLHNVENALAAVAVGLLHGVSADQMRTAFRRVRLPSLRLQRVTFRGVTMVLDCYNANPASVRAAVDELAARPGAAGRRVLVLGDMHQLGPRSHEFHWEAGRYAAQRIDALWCVGPESRAAYEGALEAGMQPGAVEWSPSVEHARDEPRLALARGDVALLKGSRAMRLERLADTLRRARPVAAGASEEALVAGTRKVG